MILTINEIKEKITPICKKYGVKRAYLFGSYAHGEATENSDIDIRIEKGKVQSLFELSGLRIDLEENLKKEMYPRISCLQAWGVCQCNILLSIVTTLKQLLIFLAKITKKLKQIHYLKTLVPCQLCRLVN